jgi:hypothetical protein
MTTPDPTPEVTFSETTPEAEALEVCARLSQAVTDDAGRHTACVPRDDLLWLIGAARVMALYRHPRRDARLKREALREAADAWTQGEWANHLVAASDPAQIRIGSANRFGEWLRERADRIEAQP